MTGVEHVVDFARIKTLFGELGLNLDPAECHGSLCGLLCATESLQGAAWVNQVLNGQLDLPGKEAAPAHSEEGEARTQLLILYKNTAVQLEDPEYGFAPLLPGDDRPLSERVEALSRWCQGFLLGLGLGGVREQSALPGDSPEVMKDFVEISRLGHDQGKEKEEDEGAYAEIVEYVRMAALLVYEELRPMRAVRPADAPVH
jgi:yecA family protein